MKKALITGVTGQDGAYLAELLLEKGYEVHGIKRRTSLFNTDRIDHLYQDPHETGRRFILHHGDLTDSSSLIRIIQQVQPDEIYNLAAQSHVAVSFEEPEYTANSDALGALRILGLEKQTRFYQASASELFGLVQEIPQKETTPFYPRSPYACAKLYAFRELAEAVKTVTGYHGEVFFDSSKRDGTPRKLLDVSRLNSMEWRPNTPLKIGLEEAYAAYVKNHTSSMLIAFGALPKPAIKMAKHSGWQ